MGAISLKPRSRSENAYEGAAILPRRGWREPGSARMANLEGGPMGPVHVRPVHREHEDADPLQRRGEPAHLLRDVGDPAHEFVRLDAALALLLRRTGRLETPRDEGTRGPGRGARSSLNGSWPALPSAEVHLSGRSPETRRTT